jgi:hypothetical protein
MAPPAPRECNQPARSALHRIPCSAGMNRRAKARGFIKTLFLAHRIANNPRTVQRAARTDNQPAVHRPPRTAHTSHMQLCARASQYFALVYLVRVLTFTKFNLYTSRIAISLCVRSSVGSQPRSLPSVPGAIPGESFRLFSSSFYFRHFHHS